eukprot:TRINITY_DN2498_c0_g1_i1.p1 TRINITY_DN2498_c0_g1~~TRINITY_DN2498_c0_g1_i1.p1  ORF type:complete len:987 (+),score=306.46 TRINITY_DN2498_c0_g1_i1:100-3060(+)
MPWRMPVVEQITRSFICILMILHAFVLICGSDNSGHAHVYLGCYDNFDTEPDFPNGPFFTPFMSPAWCIAHCEQLNAPYTGLQGGTSCFCASALSDLQQLSDKSCNSPCSGDHNQMCGGPNTISIYARNDLPDFGAPPDGQGSWSTLIINSSFTAPSFSPGRRGGHSAIAVPRAGMMVFGGYTTWSVTVLNISSNTTMDDLPNGATFTEVGIAYTTTSNVTRFNDVWRFDLGSSRWTRYHDGSGVAPKPRSSHTAVGLPNLGTAGSMIIYGGYAGSQDALLAVGDLWTFDLGTRSWAPLQPRNPGQAPGPRGDHTAVVVDSSMIVFGGADNDKYFNDVWRFRFDTNTWLQLSDGKAPETPAHRSGHTAVASPRKSLVVAFGRGRSSGSPCQLGLYRDTWEFNFQTSKWTLLSNGVAPWDANNHRWATPLPSSRYAHTAGMVDGAMIVFGGGRESNALEDIWSFDLDSHAWRELDGSSGLGPSNRSGSTVMTLADGIVVFGGEYDDDLFYNDVWRWRIGPGFSRSIPVTEPVTGWQIGIGLAVFWSLVAALQAFLYLPFVRRKQGRAREQYAVPDSDVFGSRPRRSVTIHPRFVPESARSVELPVIFRNQFDMLPDELVLRIFLNLEGYEVARLAQVCRRFNGLAKDRLVWKGVVAKHWQLDGIAPDDSYLEGGLATDDGQLDYLQFYIERYKSYGVTSKELRVYKTLKLFNTTLPFYAVLVVLAAQVYAIGLKLDNYISLQWHVVFTPLWVFDVIVVLFSVLLVYFIVSFKSLPFDRAVRRLFPFVATQHGCLFLFIVCLLWLPSGLFLAQKLDEVGRVAQWPWWAVFAPFFCILTLVAFLPSTLLIVWRRWIWSVFWLSFVGLSYLTAVVMAVAKLEFGVPVNDWCVVFLPWWVSDVFALITTICVCRELASPKLGWGVALLYMGYEAAVITLRSLLCVNLEGTCGDPVNYSYTLIFLALQFLLACVGFPAVFLLRGRFSKGLIS